MKDNTFLIKKKKKERTEKLLIPYYLHTIFTCVLIKKMYMIQEVNCSIYIVLFSVSMKSKRKWREVLGHNRQGSNSRQDRGCWPQMKDNAGEWSAHWHVCYCHHILFYSSCHHHHHVIKWMSSLVSTHHHGLEIPVMTHISSLFINIGAGTMSCFNISIIAMYSDVKAFYRWLLIL